MLEYLSQDMVVQVIMQKVSFQLISVLRAFKTIKRQKRELKIPKIQIVIRDDQGVEAYKSGNFK